MLILVGMVLVGMIKINNLFKVFDPDRIYERRRPVIYIFLMGGLLAVSFCPATAFIFFGLLIPLSIDFNQLILFPLLFAAGTLIPIVVVSIFINRGLLANLSERWIKKIPLIAGWLLIVTGIYISLEQLYL
jgi:cytochrome c biogenesis protein CcdA